MTEPERALERARGAVASMRAGGAYGEHTQRAAPPNAASARLSEWAVIDPDMRNIRSLRRWGALPTALKRALLRLLAQYHAELTAQQSRFNVKLLDELRSLEKRLEALERRIEQNEHRQ